MYNLHVGYTLRQNCSMSTRAFEQAIRRFLLGTSTTNRISPELIDIPNISTGSPPYSSLPEFEIFTGGGGRSAGSGASDLDKRTKPSNQPANELAYTPEQFIDMIDDLPYDEQNRVIQEVQDYFPTLQSFQQAFPSIIITGSRDLWEKHFGQSTSLGRFAPSGAGRDLPAELVEPSAETDVKDTQTSPPPPPRHKNERWRDWWIDSEGQRHYTATPHTYGKTTSPMKKHRNQAEICGWVQNRHSTGKGTRSSIVKQIRAYYYCHS